MEDSAIYAEIYASQLVEDAHITTMPSFIQEHS
jgi:hypothetical protein